MALTSGVQDQENYTNEEDIAQRAVSAFITYYRSFTTNASPRPYFLFLDIFISMLTVHLTKHKIHGTNDGHGICQQVSTGNVV